ncbi:cation-transporting P-type ATPase [Kitasatospora sp. NPDC001159]
MPVSAQGLDTTSGLTTAEAARLLAEHGPNEVAADHRGPLWARVGAQLRDPLIAVLLAAVALALAVALTLAIGDHPDAVVIALVIVVNTTVGVVQEVRAESAVAALSRLSAPAARVLRDGAQRKVPSAGIVPGDVVALAEGDIVPADARLVESAAPRLFLPAAVLAPRRAGGGRPVPAVPARRARHRAAHLGRSRRTRRRRARRIRSSPPPQARNLTPCRTPRSPTCTR